MEIPNEKRLELKRKRALDYYHKNKEHCKDVKRKYTDKNKEIIKQKHKEKMLDPVYAEAFRRKKREYLREFKSREPEKWKKYDKERGELRREKGEYKEYASRLEVKIARKKYKNENREKLKSKLAKYTRDREKIDINFKLRRRLRSRLKNAIKNNKKVGSFVQDLGC